MNDEQRRIIIKRIASYDQDGGSSPGRTPTPPVNRWVALFLLIPVLALMAVLGVFFFTIFVALFSIIAIVFGIRIWWLRKKFQRSMRHPNNEQAGQSGQTAHSAESVIVEDAEIIEETTVAKENQKTNNTGNDSHG